VRLVRLVRGPSRVRPGGPQISVLLLPILMFAFWSIADFAITGPSNDQHVRVSGVVTGSAVALAALALFGWYALRWGVGLTPEAAVVRRWRTRTVRWSDVTSITVRRRNGGVSRVVLHTTATTAGGGPVVLPAPRVGFLLWDRRFEDKYAAMVRCWESNRGPGRPPAPPTEPHVPYAGPRWWQQLVVGVLTLIMALELIVAAVVLTVFLAFGGN
jgi:hypothetical protein